MRDRQVSPINVTKADRLGHWVWLWGALIFPRGSGFISNIKKMLLGAVLPPMGWRCRLQSPAQQPLIAHPPCRRLRFHRGPCREPLAHRVAASARSRGEQEQGDPSRESPLATPKSCSQLNMALRTMLGVSALLLAGLGAAVRPVSAAQPRSALMHGVHGAGALHAGQGRCRALLRQGCAATICTRGVNFTCSATSLHAFTDSRAVPALHAYTQRCLTAAAAAAATRVLRRAGAAAKAADNTAAGGPI